MLRIIKTHFYNFFMRKLPQVGEYWRFDNTDPWSDHVAEILDVQNGWVKYRFVKGLGMQYTQKMDMFLYCYNHEEKE